jgi:hypothetical protein
VTSDTTGEPVRALNFEPDNRSHELKGGWGTWAAQWYRHP